MYVQKNEILKRVTRAIRHSRDMVVFEFGSNGHRQLGFLNTQNFNRRVNMYHRTKFLGDRSNRC